MFLFYLFIFIVFSCWGSFLNVIAYRIIETAIPFWEKRSRCPNCKIAIPFYDNIPIISWFVLKGKCRNCRNPISYLYPLIEITTAIIMTTLLYHLIHLGKLTIGTFAIYFIFFSALIINSRTDLQFMVIPQIFSLYIIPIGWLAAFLQISKISLLNSVISTIVGYYSLWIFGTIFQKITHKEGVGEGDMELLAMIGSFLGITGIWATLFLGSIFGLLYAIVFLKSSKLKKIPFVPFLSLAATVFFFFEDKLIKLLFNL